MACEVIAGQGSGEPLAEKDLPHWPDWPVFPADAAHAAGCELVMLGYMIWPDTLTPDTLMGRRPLPDQKAWSAQVGDFAQLQAAGI
ncbi:hypothetical protein ACSHWO_36480 (plasmid) [Streptomyces sp. HUAS TT3]|uniref:hypothetical protein n=1 Tax=Streptomyces sp. HUAS TT3 TaxID=3447510 RepID=UPI003F65CE14